MRSFSGGNQINSTLSHHFYQVEKINKANEAKLLAADEKKAKNLADVKDKV